MRGRGEEGRARLALERARGTSFQEGYRLELLFLAVGLRRAFSRIRELGVFFVE